MSEERSWQGNWKVRLYERVRERGYEGVDLILSVGQSPENLVGREA